MPRRSWLFPFMSILTLAVAMPLARAADMPIKVPVYKAHPSYYVPSWTGFYVGANAGYGFGSETASLTPTLNLFDIFSDGGIPTTAKLKPAGFFGGVQAGYNYQLSSWVLGVEADFQYSAIKGSFTVSTPGNNFVGATTTLEQQMKWFGTARARAGYLIADPLLLYATGGLAVAHISESATFLLNNGDSVGGSSSAVKTGWTVGGGAEWAFARQWTLKAEYLHYDLGKTEIDMKEIVSPFPRGATVRIPVTGNLVRAGVNYRF
jgi:outer membrane immunogenic protein